ncbi:MAG TPA: hypothetical protein VLH15_04790, partial [Dehalococcoidales bacterium]|nr:hypothetical protein [Dehalococcoidales bacterium]
GDPGLKALEEINSGGLNLIRARIEKGARFEAAEQGDIITELMDWSRCLNLGLQNQKVFSTIYKNYTDATNQRNTFIASQIDTLVKSGESCILIMGEGHHVQFPSDIQVIYVSPPALNEIKRWMRDQENKRRAEEQNNQPSQEEAGDES